MQNAFSTIYYNDLKTNKDFLIQYKNIQTHDIQYLSKDQARARWLLFKEKWIPSYQNLSEEQLEKLFPELE